MDKEVHLKYQQRNLISHTVQPVGLIDLIFELLILPELVVAVKHQCLVRKQYLFEELVVPVGLEL